MTFKDTCGGCIHLFSFPGTIFYTLRTAHFLTVWQLLLPFGIYNAFQGSWNRVEIILLVTVIYIFLFGVEEFLVQLEEPLSIFPMQGFCNNIYANSQKIIGWDTNKGDNNVQKAMAVMTDLSDVGTGLGIISEGWVKMLQVTYTSITSRIQGEGKYHTTTYNTSEIVTWTWTRTETNHRQIVDL